ncbi:Expansin-like A1 [Acorus calamus]|uniref:Expansin-like A1 n=1 Tax=Acorus calamus TaxID=4465 RepID=A0AAV9FGP9_ACOCL|nr:Expansin-like A1 [Acorus calamus]
MASFQNFMFFFFFFFFSLLLSPSIACERCVHHTKAAYFSSSTALSGGACGYGDMASSFNGGYIAAATPELYRDGMGCGGCFQIRCKNPNLCTSGGVKVIVTDINKSTQTDFVLSLSAFTAMAKEGMTRDIKRLGIVDVEYKRVPCEYKNHNLSVRIEEISWKPKYLVIKVLYQGGQTDIQAIDVAEAGGWNWRFMTRNYGAVWNTTHAPAGPLQFRMVVTGGYDGLMVWPEKGIPAEWKAGAVYDLGSQIRAVAQEACSPCDASDWQ